MFYFPFSVSVSVYVYFLFYVPPTLCKQTIQLYSLLCICLCYVLPPTICGMWHVACTTCSGAPTRRKVRQSLHPLTMWTQLEMHRCPRVTCMLLPAGLPRPSAQLPARVPQQCRLSGQLGLRQPALHQSVHRCLWPALRVHGHQAPTDVRVCAWLHRRSVLRLCDCAAK